MLGKKFDAAEKHFMKRQEKYEREIKQLRTALTQSETERSSMQCHVLELEDQVRSQADWIERLLDYTNLSQSELQNMLSEEKKANAAFAMMMDMFQRAYV